MISLFLRKPVIHVVFIALCGFIVYSNSFYVPFQFDDNYFITNNPVVEDMSFFMEPSRARPLFPLQVYKTFISRYVGFLTFALNFKIHGLNVTGFHLVNLAIHLGNALLVYWFVCVSFKTPFLARSAQRENSGVIGFFAALFFAIHPIQTEAVTFIWQRPTALVTTFCIGSIVLYAKWRLISLTPSHLPGGEGFKRERETEIASSGTPRNDVIASVAKQSNMALYVLSLLCSILAMKTKEVAFTLPVALALYEFMFFPSNNPPQSPLNLRGDDRGVTSGPYRRFLYLIPFVLTMPLVPLAHMQDYSRGLLGALSDASQGAPTLSRWEYLMTSFRVMVTYIRLILLPINQNLDYDYPAYHSLFEPEVFLSFLLLLSIFLFGVYLVRHKGTSSHVRLIAYSIFWFFITLSVESGVLPLSDLMFEHRLYLPMSGVAAGIATGGIMFYGRLKRARYRAAFMVVLVGVSLVFGVATYMRNNIWRTEIGLWEDTVSKSPRKGRVHVFMGVTYYNAGFRDKAVRHLETGLSHEMEKAHKVTAHLRLAHAYASREPEEAIRHYLSAIALQPYSDVKESYILLSELYMSIGRYDDAIAALQKALFIKADDVVVRAYLDNVYRLKSEFEAKRHLRTAGEK